MYSWVLKILLVSLHNKMGKGQNMRQFLKVVLKYAVLFYFIFKNFQNWRPFFWKAETKQASNCRTMASNLSQPETVQLCHENVNRSCIKSPDLPASWVILDTVFGFRSLLAIFGNFLVMTSVLHFKQLHSLANFLIASMACAEWPWCSSAWSGPWRGAGTLEPDFVCFRVPVMWHFVTLFSSTCALSPLTGTLLLLIPWSIPPSPWCL